LDRDDGDRNHTPDDRERQQAGRIVTFEGKKSEARKKVKTPSLTNDSLRKGEGEKKTANKSQFKPMYERSEREFVYRQG